MILNQEFSKVMVRLTSEINLSLHFKLNINWSSFVPLSLYKFVIDSIKHKKWCYACRKNNILRNNLQVKINLQ